MNNLDEEIERAKRGVQVALNGLRTSTNSDDFLFHWAHRLIFWKDELARLEITKARNSEQKTIVITSNKMKDED